MNEAQACARDIKPVSVFLDQGKIVTQEFVSPDGQVLAGYQSVPEAQGFPAWEQYGDLILGFSEKTLAWFPTEDAARAWVLERISEKHESSPVAAALRQHKTTGRSGVRAEGEPKQAEMLVFHAVLRAGSGDHHTICFLSGDVTPNNLEELCAQALERATDEQSSVRLTEVNVTLSGTQKESVVSEIRCRLRRLEPYGVKVVVV